METFSENTTSEQRFSFLVKFDFTAISQLSCRSDFHRYNLKRKVADLPPVTVEEFQNRIIQAKNSEILASEDQSLFCKACQKFFKTKNAHDNHLASKKHKESLKVFLEYNQNDEDNIEDIVVTEKASKVLEERQKLKEQEDDGMELEEVDSDEWEDEDFDNPISNNDCIFCDHHSQDFVANLKHMSVAHSFFIPDAEYCCDSEGLLSYLAEKVCRDFICIWCNEKGKTFYTCRAVRRHMIEKGHCKMLHEGAALAEYVDYYDYSASYPDHEEKMDVDAEIEPQLLEGDEYQLVLPSGLTIGHRSLMRYYKQRLNPNRAMVVKKSDQKIHHILAEYRSLGWTSLQQEAAAKKARDIHAMKRIQAKLYMQLGNKANKLQQHYRPQVNF